MSVDVFQALYLRVPGWISVTWCSYKTLSLHRKRVLFIPLCGVLNCHILAPEMGGLGKGVGGVMLTTVTHKQTYTHTFTKIPNEDIDFYC